LRGSPASSQGRGRRTSAAIWSRTKRVCARPDDARDDHERAGDGQEHEQVERRRHGRARLGQPLLAGAGAVALDERLAARRVGRRARLLNAGLAHAIRPVGRHAADPAVGQSCSTALVA
jgi:hypothetical protein